MCFLSAVAVAVVAHKAQAVVVVVAEFRQLLKHKLSISLLGPWQSMSVLAVLAVEVQFVEQAVLKVKLATCLRCQVAVVVAAKMVR
jgi:hypothetical protein